MNSVFLFLALFIVTNAYGQKSRKVEKAFEVFEKDLIPEGIAYDIVNDNFFIGSINKNKIIKVDSKKKISDFVKENAYGNWGYLGMKVDPEQQVLWACRNQMIKSADSAGYGGIFKYDLASGKLLKKYIVRKTEDSHLLNDVIIQDGSVYITDAEGGGIFVVRPGADTLETFVPSKTFIYPNGITISPTGESLIVATATGFQKIDLSSKKVMPLQFPSYYIVGIDGLYTYKESLIGIQNVIFPESINKFILSPEADVIQDIEILTYNDPVFNQATTGAIKKNHLYFISNSHLDQWEEGKIKDPSKLKNLRINRVRLD